MIHPRLINLGETAETTRHVDGLAVLGNLGGYQGISGTKGQLGGANFGVLFQNTPKLKGHVARGVVLLQGASQRRDSGGRVRALDVRLAGRLPPFLNLENGGIEQRLLFVESCMSSHNSAVHGNSLSE